MDKNWRRYNIFISSTFKDMDYERDVIKFKVIPELNRRFRSSFSIFSRATGRSLQSGS